jgi:hypothetical protein
MVTLNRDGGRAGLLAWAEVTDVSASLPIWKTKNDCWTSGNLPSKSLGPWLERRRQPREGDELKAVSNGSCVQGCPGLSSSDEKQ